MSSTMFLAVLPKETQPGDKIQISGKVLDGAEQFSINLANETNENPENIAYHFKWILARSVIVEDYKQDGYWMNYKETQFDALDGAAFALEFVFQDDGIYVYLVYEEGRNLITHYELECQLSDIKSLQVWGDVEKISQLTFSYN